MSFLVVQILPQGLVFGADRNVTTTSKGRTKDGAMIIKSGQNQRPKVLMWPNKKAIIGYVGAARIAGIPMDEWLYDFIGRNLEFTSFGELAKKLSQEVEAQRRIDEGESLPDALIIHLGGFERAEEGVFIPVVWYIRNVYGLENGEYSDVRKEFAIRDELKEETYFGGLCPREIKDRLKEMADRFEPFWFHQGFDLGTFNAFEAYLRGAFKLLIQNSEKHVFPTTINEWEQHLKMSILTYEAYFKAFKGAYEQYVGGGVDTVKLEWPS